MLGARAKHLVIGLDGADLDVIQDLGPERLPNLHKIMRVGGFARLQSVPPAATLPNWVTFLTGVSPGWHGVFDFTSRSGYQVRFDGSQRRELSTVFRTLALAGLRCACLDFPGTFPPEPLAQGIAISGWDSPVAFEAGSAFVHPPALFTEMRQRFGKLTFDDHNEFDPHTNDWLSTLGSRLCQRIERKTERFLYLLKRQRWDVFACYFGESDTAAHHLWAWHDLRSPRRPRHVPEGGQHALSDVYCALDRSVAALLEAAGSEAELTIISDHGFGGASAKVLYLNRLLCDAGFLKFRATPAISGVLKDLGMFATPPRVREKLFQLHGRWLPGYVESQVRFGHIDMSRTVAFSDELNYFPAVHLNVRGREPNGVVHPGDVESTLQRVSDALLSVRDPWTGERVVRAAHPRGALYSGPFVNRAPDLVLELNLDQGYSYNLQPSFTGRSHVSTVFRKLNESEYLGRKGRSMNGSHRPYGVWLAQGPRVRGCGLVTAKMEDATVTMLARMNFAAPARSSGKVLYWESSQTHAAINPLPQPVSQHVTSHNPAHLERRLRALGYVD